MFKFKTVTNEKKNCVSAPMNFQTKYMLHYKTTFIETYLSKFYLMSIKRKKLLFLISNNKKKIFNLTCTLPSIFVNLFKKKLVKYFVYCKKSKLIKQKKIITIFYSIEPLIKYTMKT